VSPFVSQRFVSFIASLNGTDLGSLAELIDSGKVTLVSDRSYPLERAADAVRYLETRRARGKVVVTIC
jgi:NADPH:quinone reductase-like Zn-dependent oxidoreductase